MVTILPLCSMEKKKLLPEKSVYSLGFHALPACHSDKSRTRMKLRLRHW